MAEARLGPLSDNLWFAVFDFNDDAKTGENWRLLDESEEDGVWSPLTSNSDPMTSSTIPRVKAGSIPVPSVEEAKNASGMKSFALGTTQEEAEKAMAEVNNSEGGDSFEEEEEVQDVISVESEEAEKPTPVSPAVTQVQSPKQEQDDDGSDFDDSEELEISDEEAQEDEASVESMEASTDKVETPVEIVKAVTPAKPKAAFTASDGTGFADRNAYRKYEFELSYTFKKKSGVAGLLTELRKDPGTISGQPFEIADCNHCKIMLLDSSEAVQVDYVENSRVFIGACCDSVFVRNCTSCTFTIACKQVCVYNVVE